MNFWYHILCWLMNHSTKLLSWCLIDNKISRLWMNLMRRRWVNPNFWLKYYSRVFWTNIPRWITLLMRRIYYYRKIWFCWWENLKIRRQVRLLRISDRRSYNISRLNYFGNILSIMLISINWIILSRLILSILRVSRIIFARL